ncbi:MAG: FecR domain-containing protein [Acidobacteria bacterium]|nr:FecR domain-containing protein [Acidobacteriota bacterium]
MTSLALLLMMQYVVSTKAGLVNFVQGDVNVAVGESVAAGAPIKTGPGAFAEVLLNPGSFLRMAENSEVILDNVDLSDIAVKAVSGAVVIEASEILPEFPLKVTTGNISVLIVQSGVYKFEDGKATIIEGKLETADSRIAYKKGWSVVLKDSAYRSLKIAKNESQTVLENWSQRRSALMLAANMQTFQAFRRAGFVTTARSSWMWVPTYGFYTFWPSYRTRSAYGQRNYVTYNYNEVNLGGVSGGAGGNSSGGIDASSRGGSSGSGGSGGGSYNPANDRPTSRETIQLKNPPGPPGPPPGGSN